jgi:hypothetical protein
MAPYTFTTRDYRQYSAIADLHALQFTVTHTKILSLHKSCPDNGFITVSPSPQITPEVFFSEYNLFLAIISSTAIFRTRPSSRQQLIQMNSSSTELSQLVTTAPLELPVI